MDCSVFVALLLLVLVAIRIATLHRTWPIG
ncbi:hypothetical protein HRbin27_00331 [bacterium HR27]|nr:hypothetical protein HRbin27_00331 [bacterium HR27]